MTIRDVAEYVGVSAASVSLVLNNKECRIAEETRRKIFDAAKELGYVSKRERMQVENEHGRRLIGLIYPSLEDELIDECINGVENYAAVYGYSIIQTFCADLAQRCEEQIELLASLGVAGLIVIPPVDMNTGDNNIRLGEALKASEIPYLLLDRAIYQVFCDFVTVDNKLGANLATGHLLAYGHKKIGIIAGKRGVYNTRKRVEGYKEELVLNGMEFDESLIYYGECSVETGYAGMEYLYSKGVTGVISCHEILSLGVYEYAEKEKKKIGEDISIVNFGNMRDAKWLSPKLTSVRQPGEQMGRKAAEVIVGRIQHENLGTIKTNYFTPALIEGKSVKKIANNRK